MADYDHDLEQRIARAVESAQKPLLRQIEELRTDAIRAAEVLRRDAERTERQANEDRQRLARTVQEDGQRQATEVAERTCKEAVDQFMSRLGLDPEKPGSFVQDMMFLRELRETFGTVKKHAIMVFVGIVVMGLVAGVWTAFKAGVTKP
jgi:hypothetical protein